MREEKNNLLRGEKKGALCLLSAKEPFTVVAKKIIFSFLLFCFCLNNIPAYALTATPGAGRIDVVQERGGDTFKLFKNKMKFNWGWGQNGLLEQLTISVAMFVVTYGLGAISKTVTAPVQTINNVAERVAAAVVVGAVEGALTQGLAAAVQAGIQGTDVGKAIEKGMLQGAVTGAANGALDNIAWAKGLVGDVEKYATTAGVGFVVGSIIYKSDDCHTLFDVKGGAIGAAQFTARAIGKQVNPFKNSSVGSFATTILETGLAAAVGYGFGNLVYGNKAGAIMGASLAGQGFLTGAMDAASANKKSLTADQKHTQDVNDINKDADKIYGSDASSEKTAYISVRLDTLKAQELTDGYNAIEADATLSPSAKDSAEEGLSNKLDIEYSDLKAGTSSGIFSGNFYQIVSDNYKVQGGFFGHADFTNAIAGVASTILSSEVAQEIAFKYNQESNALDSQYAIDLAALKDKASVEMWTSDRLDAAVNDLGDKLDSDKKKLMLSETRESSWKVAVTSMAASSFFLAVGEFGKSDLKISKGSDGTISLTGGVVKFAGDVAGATLKAGLVGYAGGEAAGYVETTGGTAQRSENFERASLLRQAASTQTDIDNINLKLAGPNLSAADKQALDNQLASKQSDLIATKANLRTLHLSVLNHNSVSQAAASSASEFAQAGASAVYDAIPDIAQYYKNVNSKNDVTQSIGKQPLHVIGNDIIIGNDSDPKKNQRFSFTDYTIVVTKDAEGNIIDTGKDADGKLTNVEFTVDDGKGGARKVDVNFGKDGGGIEEKDLTASKGKTPTDILPGESKKPGADQSTGSTDQKTYLPDVKIVRSVSQTEFLKLAGTGVSGFKKVDGQLTYNNVDIKKLGLNVDDQGKTEIYYQVEGGNSKEVSGLEKKISADNSEIKRLTVMKAGAKDENVKAQYQGQIDAANKDIGDLSTQLAKAKNKLPTKDLQDLKARMDAAQAIINNSASTSDQKDAAQAQLGNLRTQYLAELKKAPNIIVATVDTKAEAANLDKQISDLTKDIDVLKDKKDKTDKDLAALTTANTALAAANAKKANLASVNQPSNSSEPVSSFDPSATIGGSQVVQVDGVVPYSPDMAWKPDNPTGNFNPVERSSDLTSQISVLNAQYQSTLSDIQDQEVALSKQMDMDPSNKQYQKQYDNLQNKEESLSFDYSNNLEKLEEQKAAVDPDFRKEKVSRDKNDYAAAVKGFKPDQDKIETKVDKWKASHQDATADAIAQYRQSLVTADINDFSKQQDDVLQEKEFRSNFPGIRGNTAFAWYENTPGVVFDKKTGEVIGHSSAQGLESQGLRKENYGKVGTPSITDSGELVVANSASDIGSNFLKRVAYGVWNPSFMGNQASRWSSVGLKQAIVSAQGRNYYGPGNRVFEPVENMAVEFAGGVAGAMTTNAMQVAGSLRGDNVFGYTDFTTSGPKMDRRAYLEAVIKPLADQVETGRLIKEAKAKDDTGTAASLNKQAAVILITKPDGLASKLTTQNIVTAINENNSGSKKSFGFKVEDVSAIAGYISGATVKDAGWDALKQKYANLEEVDKGFQARLSGSGLEKDNVELLKANFGSVSGAAKLGEMQAQNQYTHDASLKQAQISGSFAKDDISGQMKAAGIENPGLAIWGEMTARETKNIAANAVVGAIVDYSMGLRSTGGKLVYSPETVDAFKRGYLVSAVIAPALHAVDAVDSGIFRKRYDESIFTSDMYEKGYHTLVDGGPIAGVNLSKDIDASRSEDYTQPYITRSATIDYSTRATYSILDANLSLVNAALTVQSAGLNPDAKTATQYSAGAPVPWDSLTGKNPLSSPYMQGIYHGVAAEQVKGFIVDASRSIAQAAGYRQDYLQYNNRPGLSLNNELTLKIALNKDSNEVYTDLTSSREGDQALAVKGIKDGKSLEDYLKNNDDQSLQGLIVSEGMGGYQYSLEQVKYLNDKYNLGLDSKINEANGGKVSLSKTDLNKVLGAVYNSPDRGRLLGGDKVYLGNTGLSVQAADTEQVGMYWAYTNPYSNGQQSKLVRPAADIDYGYKAKSLDTSDYNYKLRAYDELKIMDAAKPGQSASSVEQIKQKILDQIKVPGEGPQLNQNQVPSSEPGQLNAKDEGRKAAMDVPLNQLKPALASSASDSVKIGQSFQDSKLSKSDKQLQGDALSYEEGFQEGVIDRIKALPDEGSGSTAKFASSKARDVSGSVNRGGGKDDTYINPNNLFFPGKGENVDNSALSARASKDINQHIDPNNIFSVNGGDPSAQAAAKKSKDITASAGGEVWPAVVITPKSSKSPTGILPSNEVARSYPTQEFDDGQHDIYVSKDGATYMDKKGDVVADLKPGVSMGTGNMVFNKSPENNSYSVPFFDGQGFQNSIINQNEHDNILNTMNSADYKEGKLAQINYYPDQKDAKDAYYASSYNKSIGVASIYIKNDNGRTVLFGSAGVDEFYKPNSQPNYTSDKR